ncbi:hypothetical protein RSOCI_02940 [Rhabdochlamydiaceae symbiont of Dictyostelium giganteum]
MGTKTAHDVSLNTFISILHISKILSIGKIRASSSAGRIVGDIATENLLQISLQNLPKLAIFVEFVELDGMKQFFNL